ncbi:MAG: Radical protein [Thermoproteota archaeon]|nr:Radical protein [Thermoproteota archaeon]
MAHFDFILLHSPRAFEKFSTDMRGRIKNLFSPKKTSQEIQTQYALMPMGLISLASSLKKNGYTVKIINLALNQALDPTFNVLKYSEYLESSVFAINMHCITQTASALELASILKKQHPNSLIVLGGMTATHFHREIMERSPFVDAILLGEADLSIIQLAQAYLSHKRLDEVRGITYREEGKVKYVPPEPPEDIDSLDFTQLELLENYRANLKLDTVGYSDILSKRLWLNTARGCPYNCIHCGGGREAYYQFSRREKPALRSPKRVAEDITRLKEFGVEGVCLSHDLEIFGAKYWSDLFNEIRARSIDISAYVESFRLPSRELIEGLRDTFSSTMFGLSPETASEDVRKNIGRDFSNDDLIKSVENLRDSGLNTRIYFSIGLPGERLDLGDLYQGLIDKLFRSGAFVVLPSIYTIEPNCLMALNPEKYGVNLILKDLNDYKELCPSQNPSDWIGHETAFFDKEEVFKLKSEVHDYIINYYQALSPPPI